MRLPSHIVTLLALVFLGSLATGQGFYDRTVLRTLELEFAQSDWNQQLRTNKLAGLQEYIPADLTVDGVLYPNVGVRYKGNSTYWSIPPGVKKPISIDMNIFTSGQKIMGHSKLVLNNQGWDPSLMREVIAYKIMNQFIPSSRANFVKVTINGENYGIYTNIEHVGEEMCEDRFGDDGFRYKAAPPWSWPDTLTTPPPPGDLALQDINNSLTRAEVAYELKNMETDPDHHQGILAAINVLTNTPNQFLVEDLDPLLDIDHALWHLALNNTLCSMDAYYSSGQNYYLFQDAHHGRLMILPWDFNMSFGIYGQSQYTVSPVAGKGDDERPLLSRLVKGDVLRQEYLAHVHTAAFQGLDPIAQHAEIEELRALIDAEVQLDGRLHYLYGDWVSYGVDSLKNFIQNRYDFLIANDLLNVERPMFSGVAHSPEQPTSIDRVKFLAQVDNPVDPIKSVLVYVRIQGAFQELELFDDGLNGDGAANDGLYGVSTPPFPLGSKVEYYFHARCTTSKAITFSPQASSASPYSFVVDPGAVESDILINEFVASNDDGPVDEMGENEDWIELYNRGASVIDLSGMWLSDDLEELPKWQFPIGTSLAPNQTLMIWADNDPLDGPLHTNFKLSKSGEEIFLVDADGTTILDFISFGSQESDVSTARLLDGGDLWVTLPSPTPDARNEISCGERSYDGLDSSRNTASLSLSGTPSSGAVITLDFDDLTPSQLAQLHIGSAPIALEHGSSGLISLVSNIVYKAAISADANGHAQLDFNIPANAALIGKSFYLQAGALGSNPIATHALEVVICP